MFSRKILDLILNELIAKLRTDLNIVSLTHVGSFANKNKKFEKVNDIDIVIILKKIQQKTLQRIQNIATALSKKYSTKYIGITYLFKIGPIKKISKKKFTIMLHFLIYPENEYKRLESTLTRYSFQQYKPLLGKSLKEINNVKNLTTNDLLNEIDGIPAMKNWIMTKRSIFVEPIGNKIKVGYIKLNNIQYAEIIIYSVLNLARNLLRIHKKFFDIDMKMCEEFKKSFPKLSHKNLPRRFCILKKKIRGGKKLRIKESKSMVRESLFFIEEIENYLKCS